MTPAPQILALGPSWLDPQHLLDSFGPWALWGALLVVFVECGLFIFLLPGDSLLFTIGLLVGQGSIDQPLWLVCLLLTVAAIAGNVVGYEIGRAMGPRIVRPGSRLIKHEHVEQTYAFFDKYGARAIVLARFVPIVRTFVTVVAGVGRMDRKRFFTFSLVGAILWATGVTVLGYFLGSVPFVKNNVEAMLIAIVLVSVLPMVFEVWKARRAKGDERYDEPAEQQRVEAEDITG